MEKKISSVEESSATRTPRLRKDPKTSSLLALHVEVAGVIFGMSTSRTRIIFAVSFTAEEVSVIFSNTLTFSISVLISLPAFSKSFVLDYMASIASSMLLKQTLFLSANTLLRISAALGFLAIDLRSFLRDSA